MSPAALTRFGALVVLTLALACASLPGTRSSATSGIANFRAVSGDLYSGARPGDARLAYLQRIGRITGNARDIEHERVEAQRLGIGWVHKPMSAFAIVDDAQMDEA